MKMRSRSLGRLMRSIQDKESIKKLRVPSPSERNPDGSMKTVDQKERPDRNIKNVGEKIQESTYKVSHKGHSTISSKDGTRLLFPVNGKEYVNHITKYPESAKKTADILRKKGFKDVAISKDGKLIEESELEENN